MKSIPGIIPELALPLVSITVEFKGSTSNSITLLTITSAVLPSGTGSLNAIISPT